MEVGAMYTLCCEFEKRIHLGDEEFHDVRDELGWQLFHSRGVGPPSHPSLSFAALPGIQITGPLLVRVVGLVVVCTT